MTQVAISEQARSTVVSRPDEAKPLQYAVKGVLDRLAAAAALGVLGPAGVLLGVAIRLESDGPALFMQDRIGRDGRPFKIYKFRTLNAGEPVIFNDDGSTRVAPKDPRVTRIGMLLRGGIDELPQLINVLRGDMSIVGPRPDMTVHETLYTPERRQKLYVRPGITSLAAVLGRNKIPWQRRMAIDVRYVDHWSLLLDAKIVLSTLCLPLAIRPFSFEQVLDDLDDE